MLSKDLRKVANLNVQNHDCMMFCNGLQLCPAAFDIRDLSS